MMRRLSLAALGLCLLVPCVSAQGFDELLPDSTLFYMSIEDVARTKERYKASSLSALWNDPAIQAFLEVPSKSWAKMIESSKKHGVTLDDMADVLNGKFVFAIVAGDDAPMIFLADVKGNEGKLREILRLNRENAEENQHRVEEEDFRGISLTRISKTVGDEEQEVLSYFHDDGLLAVADRAEDLRALIARRGEAEGTLASKEHYREVRRRLGGRGDVFLFLDMQQVKKTLIERKTFDAKDIAIYDALGLGPVQSVAMSMALAEDGLRMQMQVSHTGKKEGFLKLFAAENRRREAPRWVPEDAVEVGVFAFNLAELWDEIVKVADKVSPGAGVMMAGALEMTKGATGVDIKTDLLGALGDEISYYIKLPDPAEAGAMFPMGAAGNVPIPRMVFSFQVKDMPRFEGALNKLLAAGGEVEEREYLGVKMRVFQLGLPIVPAFALLPGEFIFALQVDDLKEVISRHGKDVKGLVDSDMYERVLAGLPAERAWMSFTDVAKSLSGSMFWLGLASGMGNAKLPTEDVLKKYLDGSASVMVNEDNAIAFHWLVRLKPRAKGDGDDESDDDGR
ncbi:MAG: DUF3352 domain-containing protein [Planctomycetota bacterium]|nr:DUF3352 domain-containing protein [Planctomycetota bacterium]